MIGNRFSTVGGGSHGKLHGRIPSDEKIRKNKNKITERIRKSSRVKDGSSAFSAGTGSI